MAFPIEILNRDGALDPQLDEEIRAQAGKLEQVFDGIVACHVALESPHHARHGRREHVRITLTVPGRQIVISHDPGAVQDDPRVAVHEAFRAARRRLEAWVKRDLRRETRRHAAVR